MTRAVGYLLLQRLSPLRCDVMKDKDVNVNKLAMELIVSRRWLLSVVGNLESLSTEEKAQYDYTLLWVQTQQEILDELEWNT